MTFELLQDLIPAGKKGKSTYRPSRLNRREWQAFLQRRDDRAMSTKELRSAGHEFSSVAFAYDGMTARLTRLIPNKKLERLLNTVDSVLTKPNSPLRRFSRSTTVTFTR